MNEIAEGLARAICLAIWDHDYTPRDPLHPDARWLQAMKAAKSVAGFMAENGSEAIAKHLCRAVYGIPVGNPIPAPMLDSMTWRIAASIRAVAGDEVK